MARLGGNNDSLLQDNFRFRVSVCQTLNPKTKMLNPKPQKLTILSKARRGKDLYIEWAQSL